MLKYEESEAARNRIVEELLNDLLDKVVLGESKTPIPTINEPVPNVRLRVDERTSCFYALKWIEFHDTQCAILLQNENGPCPLISICNCLLLRGHLKIEPVGLELIENDKLIQMLADVMLSDFVPRYMVQHDRGEINIEQNISDALSIFDSLQYGLNVNVRFNSCTSFEYTREMDIFDLFGIRLYHGWLIDSEQTEFYRYRF